MATHCSVLAWRIPGTGEPGGLPSLGSHRVGHDWSDLAAAAAVFSTEQIQRWLHWVPVFNGKPDFLHCQSPSIRWELWFLPHLCYKVQFSLSCVWLRTKLCLTLCNPMDSSPLVSSAYGIFQARILEWVVISFSKGSSPPRDQIWVSWTTGRFFTHWAIRDAPVMVQTSRHNYFPGRLTNTWMFDSGIGFQENETKSHVVLGP